MIIQRDDKWDPRRKKYFHPRFAIVLQGQEIKWTNHDTRNHRLVSGNPDTLISDGVFDSGEILIGSPALHVSILLKEHRVFPIFAPYILMREE